MMVNVFFAVPRRGLIDETARNLLHLELRLRRRGQATVYRIFPSDWSMEGIVTIRKGWVDLGKPSKELKDAYEEMKHRHGIQLLEKASTIVVASQKKYDKQLEKVLKPAKGLEEQLERARLILPQIYKQGTRSWQGRIDVSKMMRVSPDMKQHMAYRVRAALIEEIRAGTLVPPSESGLKGS